MNQIDTSSVPDNASASEMLYPEEVTLAQRVEASVRANPVPVIVTAVAIGVAAGVIIRLLTRDESPSGRAAEFLRRASDQFRDASDHLREYVEPFATNARSGLTSGISRSGDAIRGVVDDLPSFKSLGTHLREWWYGR